MDAITRRVAANLSYLDAKKSLLLHSARKTPLAAHGAPASLVDSRGHALERERFSFQAAFFCYGCMIGEKGDSWAYALWEEQQSDFDCIFRRRSANGSWAYEPVQLKEVPPAEPKDSVSLETLFAKLATHYRNNRDLRVGIYLNRDGVTQLDHLAVPMTNVASLWLYGVGGELSNGGFLFGNLLTTDRRLVHFELPKLPASLTMLPRSARADP
jgi:hypothetical protein